MVHTTDWARLPQYHNSMFTARAQNIRNVLHPITITQVLLF